MAMLVAFAGIFPSCGGVVGGAADTFPNVTFRPFMMHGGLEAGKMVLCIRVAVAVGYV